ncbi:hypothetical protein OAK38_04850 [Verrucomicrobia bacterium]|nr:hypothetical protein [Verrucomicrobiota bacterium]
MVDFGRNADYLSEKRVYIGMNIPSARRIKRANALITWKPLTLSTDDVDFKKTLNEPNQQEVHSKQSQSLRTLVRKHTVIPLRRGRKDMPPVKYGRLAAVEYV